jgi:hypothetical protein
MTAVLTSYSFAQRVNRDRRVDDDSFSNTLNSVPNMQECKVDTSASSHECKCTIV